MTRPDVSTPEGLKTYRAELRRVAWPLRLGGFVLIVAGAVYLVAAREGWLPFAQWAVTTAYGAVALGWALFLSVIFIRTRHHRRRMREMEESA